MTDLSTRKRTPIRQDLPKSQKKKPLKAKLATGQPTDCRILAKWEAKVRRRYAQMCDRIEMPLQVGSVWCTWCYKPKYRKRVHKEMQRSIS
jgi:hypothetical protein